jgi:PIN domain nuclease of toxin-antitoxin system
MFVTDTHPLLWYLEQRYSKLSRRVKDIFDTAMVSQSTALVIPTAVLWELSLIIKSDRQHFHFKLPYKDIMSHLFQIPTVIEEPITRNIVERSHELNFHRDPFDTMIVATALERGLPLITNDSVIHETKPCKLIW